MAAITDLSVGYGVESTYGTIVTTTRWLEQVPPVSLTVNPVTVQSQGLRVGSVVDRDTGEVIVAYDGDGSTIHEATTKGMGIPLRAAFGTAASTLVSGSTYQQNYSLGSAPSPLTIQGNAVQADGTVLPHTFAGCMCKSFELDSQQNEIVKLTYDWDPRSVATATAYTSPTYVAAPINQYHFAQGAITIGGTVTAPTTTALATGGTAVANITSFNFKLDNGMGASRWAYGGAGLKSAAAPRGIRSMTGKITAELTDTVLRDAALARTSLGMVLTFTSSEALSTGFATMSLYLPVVRFTTPIPQSDGSGDVTVLDLEYKAFDATSPVVLSLRTADTAI